MYVVRRSFDQIRETIKGTTNTHTRIYECCFRYNHERNSKMASLSSFVGAQQHAISKKCFNKQKQDDDIQCAFTKTGLKCTFRQRVAVSYKDCVCVCVSV